MKTIVKAIDLSNAVSKVVKAVSAKSPNQLLEGIKLSCKGDSLTLTATDTEIAIEKTIRCETFMEGETVVPGRLFAEFTKKLETEDDIELTLLDDNRLKISYSSSESILQALPANEFPIIKKDVNRNSFVIKQKAFKDLILSTVFACSQDDSRPILKGCLLELEGDKLTCVALDGFRLAVCKRTVSDATGNVKAIVPSRALLEITRLIEKDEDMVTVVIQDNSLMIDVDNTVFTTRLLEGEYIEYKKIVPQNYLTTFKANKQAMYTSIERASILAKVMKNIVKFDVKETGVDISSDSEFGAVKETVLITLEGKDITIAFNSRYILDCLRVINDEFINFNLNSPISPCVIKSTSDDEYLYLILPVRLNQ
ncbi:MAG: DNA polymerase III subunit beta [Clostridia bacterium]|nr:DNA polymerase III subunit beta [Clostridia bacterium]